MGDVIQDLRYAVRTLCKTPAFLFITVSLPVIMATLGFPSLSLAQDPSPATSVAAGEDDDGGRRGQTHSTQGGDR
jgi:hypothetical protein